MDNLTNSRNAINRIDEQLAKLFEERMEAAKVVAAYKKEHGLPIFDATREAQLIEKNTALIENEEIKNYFINFLQSTMDISKRYQYRLNEGMRVAFSGVLGAFAEIAAKKAFIGCKSIAYPSFKDAYKSVENGECDVVLLPIENSYNGDVGQVMDLAFFGSLYINGIYDFSVTQCLIANSDTRIEDITEVVSHPQALGQCSGFIREHKLKMTECYNTAVAAQLVAESQRNDFAAIGSEEAANEYGLTVLQKGINDNTSNTTRFAAFSRALKNSHINDRQFIMLFTVRNESGCLGKALSIIGENGFNLRALKSRPTKELIWDYYFYAEGEGNIFTDKGKKMIEELDSACSNVKIVGSFEKDISI